MYTQQASQPVFTPQHNASVAKATNILTGNLGKVRMQAFSHNAEHMALTLALWKKQKIQNIVCTPASTHEDENIRLQENEMTAFNSAKTETLVTVPTTIPTTTKKEKTAPMTATTTTPTTDLVTTNVQSLQDVQAALQTVSQEDIDTLQLRDVPMLGTSFASIEKTDVAWLWDNYLPLKPTLVTGEPGTKKSMLAAYVASIVSTGGIWPDGSKCDRGAVLWINEEDSDSDTTSARLTHFGADLSRVYSLNEVTDTQVQLHANTAMPFSLPRHLSILEQTIIAREITLVIFDPCSKIFGKEGKKEETCGPNIMQPLTKMCDSYGVSMLLINHFKNGIYNNNNVLTAIGGSYHNSVRMSYTAMLDAQTGYTVLKQLKNNLGETMQPLSYRLVKDTRGVLGLDFPFGRNTTLLEKISAHEKSTLKTKIIALLAYRGYGMSTSAVSQQLGQNAGSVRTEMRRMIASNELQQNEHGEYELGKCA